MLILKHNYFYRVLTLSTVNKLPISIIVLLILRATFSGWEERLVIDSESNKMMQFYNGKAREISLVISVKKL